MTTGQHGGYRRPSRPAAVSNPQSGARTDGGAADPQGVRVASGGPYGARQAAEQQQAAAPVAGGASRASRPSPRGGAAPAGPGAFGPTARPNEPINAGLNPMGQMMAQQQDTALTILQAIYDRYPSPYIAALMNRM